MNLLTHILYFLWYLNVSFFRMGKTGWNCENTTFIERKRKSMSLFFTPLTVVLRFFFCFRLLIFWGNFVECMILFLARVIFVVVVGFKNGSSYKRFRCNCCCSYGNNYNKFLNVIMMSDNKKTLISEERIFGESFIIIRRKYMPNYDDIDIFSLFDKD